MLHNLLLLGSCLRQNFQVVLPDTEFIINLGDWPLMKKSSDLIPIISWCKTNEHSDILWPTYELTQAYLECMGRFRVLQSCYFLSLPASAQAQKTQPTGIFIC